MQAEAQPGRQGVHLLLETALPGPRVEQRRKAAERPSITPPAPPPGPSSSSPEVDEAAATGRGRGSGGTALLAGGPAWLLSSRAIDALPPRVRAVSIICRSGEGGAGGGGKKAARKGAGPVLRKRPHPLAWE